MDRCQHSIVCALWATERIVARTMEKISVKFAATTKFMTKFILSLVVILSTTSICHADKGDSYANLKTAIKVDANFQSADKDEYSGKYVLIIDLNEKCGIRAESRSVINLVQGQILVGSSSAQDRVTYKDAGSIGASITTQVDFTSSDQKINLTIACFDQGIAFRSVPSLSDLLALVNNKGMITLKLEN